MRQKLEGRKAETIDRVAELARERLGDSGKAAEAEALIRLFYKNVPAEDVQAEDPLDLFGAAMALWRFAETRAPGQPKIRAYNPKFEEDGWHSTHTVVEIVNDDMPFLVDSVTAELNRRELGVHLVIHPVAHLARDAKGKRKGLAKDAKDGLAESLMQIRVSARSSAETLEQIQSGLASVLADVRAAVTDWRVMRKKLLDVVAQIEKKPPPLPAEEVKEGLEFLRWLEADHFTFLGYRDFTYEAKAGRMAVNPDSGLGVVRDPAFHVFGGMRNISELPPEVRAETERPLLISIAKGNRASSVHRPVLLDVVTIKDIDKKGAVVGQWQVVGLFTSVAYNGSVRAIPLLRHKVAETLKRAGFTPGSHNGKNLATILEAYPRDELLQIDQDLLFDVAMGILNLQERQRIALFLRPDTFRRFISALVYVPRDIYNTELRRRFQAIIEQSLNGPVTQFYTQISDSVLARLHFIVRTDQLKFPEVEAKAIETKLIEAARSWRDHLSQALIEAKGEEKGLSILDRYGDAFGSAYRERFPGQIAVSDIDRVEESLASGQVAMNLYTPLDAEGDEVHFKVFNPGKPIALSDILPMLENMGLKVLEEVPFRVKPKGAETRVWIQDFSMRLKAGGQVPVSRVKQAFHDAFRRVWTGEAENDGFNRLVLGAGLTWREVVILRAYAKYLRQTGFTFSQTYIEDALADHPEITRLLVLFFTTRFSPADRKDAELRANGAAVEVEHALDAVTNLDQDRILRRFINLIRSTQRTNFFQMGAGGQPKPYLSFKLDSQKIEDLPLPRPLVEIWVYSPRVEGVHLRGGRVARGGIRWSDRREDFRTEILGLMKAQMVKNAVIVPVGSKGGFFVKNPPTEGGREAFQAEGIECYRTFMRGLLDITDNAVGGKVAPPKDVARLDQDDPYLVVAADKGTATFSDIANGISREYGFWLDDAFASGGSAGYDHKKMAITARGAWENVKRHFREMGRDCQTTAFDCVGVGDMAGDVFGNGMLRSKATRLVCAFNHMHIFIDPSPDPATSFAERERLFNLPRSSWKDYDAKLISAGGGIFERSAKSIKLSPEMKKLIGLDRDAAMPAELIQAILRMPVDLIFFGGIGTFIRASSETNAEVGDRANDALRITAKDVRAKIIGEGANLGMTQRARIEAGLLGIHLNTDAIDNSAGVDCSDHEVNIKILLGDVCANGDMTIKQRDQLLASMTEQVGELVLQDNIDQSLALTLSEADGPQGIEEMARLMRTLERIGLLDRAIEFLPGDPQLAERQAAERGLSRPELAVLLAYAKMALYNDLLPSDLPDDPTLTADLESYFPDELKKRFKTEIARHKLKREIVATVVTNALVNRAGQAFVSTLADKTGSAWPEIARAYLIARDAFALGPMWEQVQALDLKVRAEVQTQMHRSIRRLSERASLWFLNNGKRPLKIADALAEFRPGIGALTKGLGQALPEGDRAELDRQAKALADAGVPRDLAHAVSQLDRLAAAPDIVRLGGDPLAVARVYYALGQRLGLDWLKSQAAQLKPQTDWQRQAAAAVLDDLYGHQAMLARRVLADSGELKKWVDGREPSVERVDQLLTEMRAAPAVDLAMLAVANRRFGELAGA
ncbi:MAG: NAD-glutamate dehydrogenase [Alphaproteobacteria bacterium]|nr:NAD-glutamate dehydrogenase [Alphaproteobacteria bacterium]